MNFGTNQSEDDVSESMRLKPIRIRLGRLFSLLETVRAFTYCSDWFIRVTTDWSFNNRSYSFSLKTDTDFSEEHLPTMSRFKRWTLETKFSLQPLVKTFLVS